MTPATRGTIVKDPSSVTMHEAVAGNVVVTSLLCAGGNRLKYHSGIASRGVLLREQQGCTGFELTTIKS